MRLTEQVRTFRCAIHNAGSFYATLAQAGLHADPANRARLLTCFPELTAQYGPRSSLYDRMYSFEEV